MNRFLLYAGLASALFSGCDTQHRVIANGVVANIEGEKVEEKYIEGRVIGESIIQSASYPYAFTIKDIEGEEQTFAIYHYNAAAFDSKINTGDLIKIDKSKITKNSVLREDTLESSKYIEVLERAGSVKSAEKE